MLNLLHKLEDLLLASLLGSMIILACTQIFLRNFFDSGFTWADPLLRVMVLWLGMLGALAASRGNRHIVIDVLSPVMSDGLLRYTRILTSLFTAFICVAVAWYAGHFVYSEWSYGGRGAAGLPTAVLASIIPVTFGLMGLRFVVHAGLLFKQNESEAESS